MKSKNRFFKLIYIYFFIIILFFILINSFSNNKNCKAIETNILFVGGVGENNYSKIQNAIDNSKENETIQSVP